MERVRRSLLRDFRGERSQADMAKLYNVDQRTWSTWETGRATPALPLMKQLSTDSNIPMDVLFADSFTTQNG